jgi:hypothetical protein
LAIPTLDAVTTFYNNAYVYPQQVQLAQPFAELTTSQISSMETSQLRQDSIVTNITENKNLHLSGTSWVQGSSTNLTGVVTSVGSVTSIPNGNVTNDMLANGAVANLSGTNTGDQTVAAANGFAAASGSAFTLGTTVTGILVGSGGSLIAASSPDITSKILVGFASSSGAVASTDSILQAIEKLDGNTNGAPFLPLAGGTMSGPIGGVTTLTASSGGQLVLNAVANRVDIGAGVDFHWSWMPIVVMTQNGGPFTTTYNGGQVKSVSLTSMTSNILSNFTLNTGTGVLTYTGTPNKLIRINYTFGIAPNAALVAGTIQTFVNVNGQTTAIPAGQRVIRSSWAALSSTTIVPASLTDTFIIHNGDTLTLGGFLSSGITQTVAYYDVSVDIFAHPL